MRIFFYILSMLIIFIAGMSFQTNQDLTSPVEEVNTERVDMGWEEHELEKDLVIMREDEHPLYPTTSFIEGFFGALFDKLVQLLYAIASLFFGS